MNVQFLNNQNKQSFGNSNVIVKANPNVVKDFARAGKTHILREATEIIAKKEGNYQVKFAKDFLGKLFGDDLINVIVKPLNFNAETSVVKRVLHSIMNPKGQSFPLTLAEINSPKDLTNAADVSTEFLLQKIS